MQYKITAVNPQGRQEYGSYVSTSNVTKRIVGSYYAGDATNNGLGGNTGGGNNDQKKDDV
jgi:hypothetical protein